MDKKIIIILEDIGQDITRIICNHKGVIVKTEPYQSEIWEGGLIPLRDKVLMKIGNFCPIHKPPHISYGYLGYKIQNILLER